MEISTDIQEANLILQGYSGAKFQIVMYSSTLRRIALKLTLTDVQEVVYVVGIGCESINGRFDNKDAKLHITEEVKEGEVTSVIADKSGQFTLTTNSGFTLAKGV